MEQMQKILIIDDEIQIRKILRITLEAGGYKIIESGSGQDGIIQAASANPHLIILDLGLPDMDGHSVLKSLRDWSSIPVIVLSVRNSEEEIIKALNGGADDYLTKPFNTGELIARIKANLRRTYNIQESNIYLNGELKIDITNHIVTKNDVEIKLTVTEYQLLLLFAKNSGKVLTHKYILKEVWGNAFSEQNQNVRVFIGQLRKKIENDPAHPEFIITESGVGYRMVQKTK